MQPMQLYSLGCYSAFYFYSKASNLLNIGHGRPTRASVSADVKSLSDIIFLTRLFKVNEWLWLGEWLFHITFLMVMIRHLRYFIDPVPDWVMNFQTAGICAGYVFLLALVYIMAFKLFIEKKKYLSSYNFFLLTLLFLIAVSGFLMKNFIRTDIVNVKTFMIGVFSFKILEPPVSMLFSIHLIVSLIFLIFLPAHIIAAPLTIIDARRRDEGLEKVLHED
ncbi:MAG: hypothetical protein DDT19_01972 [Syntrophomonadaceae bacterium]|nr:hypothetical protein [Bacillota bacterium]